MCRLLEWWEAAEGPDPTLDNDLVDEWNALEAEFQSVLRRLAPSPRLGTKGAALLADAVERGPLAAHAAAWALDRTRFTFFGRAWASGGPVALEDGDLFPVGEWDTDRRPLRQRMSHPWQTEREARELPHVRRHQAADGHLAVEFDVSVFHELSFVADANVFAVGLPNASMGEFNLPPSGFPIECENPEEQVARLLQLVAEAIATNVDVLVLPELAGHSGAVGEVMKLTAEADRPMLVVPGSMHVVDDLGAKRNTTWLVPPGGPAFSHSKRIRFWGKDLREGIDPCDEPLRLIVAEDLRILVLICKDMLNTGIIDTAARYGANLLLVTAMSPSLNLHDVKARELAMRSHALTFVGNGPPDHLGAAAPALLVALPESEPAEIVYLASGEPRSLVVWRLDGSAGP